MTQNILSMRDYLYCYSTSSTQFNLGWGHAGSWEDQQVHTKINPPGRYLLNRLTGMELNWAMLLGSEQI